MSCKLNYKISKFHINLFLIFFFINCGIVQVKHKYKGHYRTSQEIENLKKQEAVAQAKAIEDKKKSIQAAKIQKEQAEKLALEQKEEERIQKEQAEKLAVEKAILEKKETARIKKILNSKNKYRFKVGSIQKNKMLKNIKSNYKRQGYRGAQLNRMMKGAKIGVKMGLSSMSFKLLFKKNKHLVITTKEKNQVLDYKIKRRIVYIKTGTQTKYKKYAKLGRGNRTLTFYQPNTSKFNGPTFQKY